MWSYLMLDLKCQVKVKGRVAGFGWARIRVFIDDVNYKTFYHFFIGNGFRLACLFLQNG
jgi:hypothetical protein